MEKKVVLRTGKDRLRYTIMFEVLLIAFLVPAGSLFFEREPTDIGLLAVVLALKAMLINLLYNWVFDRWDAKAGRIPTERNFMWRAVHAIGLEIGLVLTSLPIVTWWLDLTIWQALLMDVAVTSFVVLYTFVFTWGYDRFFPVRQHQ